MDDVNALPILRTDALKYIVVFRNHLRPGLLIEAISAFLKLLSSRHTILHQYTAYALERLMLVKCKETGKVHFCTSGSLFTLTLFSVQSFKSVLFEHFILFIRVLR